MQAASDWRKQSVVPVLVSIVLFRERSFIIWKIHILRDGISRAMLQYFTNASRGGWVIHGQFPPLPIAVLEAPYKHLPVGIATEVGKTRKGFAVWSLCVHGTKVPGHFVIVDRAFVQVELERPEQPDTIP